MSSRYASHKQYTQIRNTHTHSGIEVRSQLILSPSSGVSRPPDRPRSCRLPAAPPRSHDAVRHVAFSPRQELEMSSRRETAAGLLRLYGGIWTNGPFPRRLVRSQSACLGKQRRDGWCRVFGVFFWILEMRAADSTVWRRHA